MRVRWTWLWTLLASGSTSGCGGAATPRWAVQHGTVDVQSASVDGYQVWEFFSKKWKRKRKEKRHICSLLQQMSGDLVSDLDGCLDCIATYQLTVTDLETDCEADVVGNGGFGGVRYLAVGAVPDDQAQEDPYPGRSMGWYLSWDGQIADFMGFVYHEDLDLDGTAPVAGWSPSERYVLDPVFAWEL